MQKIVPHFWFDKEAKEAAAFYVSLFPDSKIEHTTVLQGTPSGSVDVVTFKLAGYSFQAISAGPLFKPNPSISFMVNFDPSRDEKAREHLDELWNALADGGTPLMPLGEYPFSKRYGWIRDKYGVSWQLILTDPAGEPRPFIIPSLLFVTDAGKAAEEAVKFYVSLFKDAKVGTVARYPAGMEPNMEGAIMFSDFTLAGQWFAAMDASRSQHDFAFNEAISLIVHCETQDEIDYYWERLSADPKAEQCGWLKDAYGVSWQIVPSAMDRMMREGTPEQIARVTRAFLPMKKFDLATLERAYSGS